MNTNKRGWRIAIASYGSFDPRFSILHPRLFVFIRGSKKEIYANDRIKSSL